MSIFESFKDILTRKNSEDDVPEGFCPNCWGRQEYSGQFYEAVYREKIDLNNVEEKRGWIEAYAAQNLNGIQLHQDGDDLRSCPSCNLVYRPA